MPLKRFFSSRPRPRAPDGWRAYVIGDVHGCLHLLDRLIDAIVADHASRAPARGLLVLVGDLIDRGPDSAGVIERLRTVDLSGFRLVTLAGNHEEVLLRILGGDASQIAGWLRFGGAEALGSWNVDAAQVAALAPADAQALIAAAVTPEQRSFLDSLGDSFRFGDYLFVHAGIRPGIPLEEQSLADLRWIREPFLSDRRDHGMMVVHGHTISNTVEEVGNRIGIDTGAYRTGRLTALGIEGEERWVLDTLDAEALEDAALV
jgi:serine/threonine protein phosphatase 1